MRAPRTHFILMLDSSWSMRSAYPSMRKGVEQILASLKGIENLTVDVWQFGTNVHREVDNQPIESVNPARSIEFDAGATALNYALGCALDAKLQDGLDMEEAVLLLMISDGENGGGFVEGLPANILKDRIELLRNSGQWMFTVFAAPFGRRDTKEYFETYGLDHDFHTYTPGDEGTMWNLIESQLGDYMHARQGGTTPDHLKD